MYRHILFVLLLAPLGLAPSGFVLGGTEDGNSRTLPSTPDVVVNEIMYAPASPEPEWIELVNRGTEPVNIKKWQISDATASKHLLPSLDILLPAGGFVILTRDSSVLHAARGLLPCAVINVGGFPSLNNGGDAVMLCDAQGSTVDSLVYSPDWGGCEGGRSLERRDADAPSTEQRTWGSSVASGGATPGQPNSIRRRSYDLSIAAKFLPVAATDTCIAIIHNVGKLPASGYRVLVYDDTDLDSVVAPGELVGQWEPGASVLPDDSVRIPCAVMLSPGFHQLIVMADFAADEEPGNNRALCTATKPYPHGALLINEIMAEPAAGQSEYVELVNGSGFEIDVKGWGISDLSLSAGKVQISAARCVVHPGEFLVLAADSSLMKQFPALASMDPRLVVVFRTGHISLNNEGDAVIIRDALGVTVDSVGYSATWHNPDLSDPAGRSLERISPGISSNDPRNWSTCVAPSGGTPGLRNSISIRSVPAASRLSCAPNPFSPDGDGVDDITVIHYEMPLLTSIINVKIYDVRGRLIRRLASSEPGGGVGDVIWDGRDDSGAVARIGIYIAFLEAVNGSGTVESAKGVLVLARRL
jgi:hypothetical protein